jgi:hypothetical protein
MAANRLGAVWTAAGERRRPALLGKGHLQDGATSFFFLFALLIEIGLNVSVMLPPLRHL